jgi:WD40 repeat protein
VLATVNGYEGPSGFYGRPALVEFSPDGRMLALSGPKAFVNLYEAETGRLLYTLSTKREGGLDAFSFSPDSRTLVTYHNRSTQVWDTETGALRRTLKKSSTDSVAFSPDSLLLATCGGNASARLWDVQTGKLVRELTKSEKETHYVAFSPEGRLLLTASDAGVRLWDVASGEQAAALTGSRFPARFSADGLRLATGGNERRPPTSTNLVQSCKFKVPS